MNALFINLPVRDLAVSVAFYEALGFTKAPEFSNDDACGMRWSDGMTLMLLTHPFYTKFLRNREVIDAQKTSGVLIAIGLESRAAVEKFAETAKVNGGDYYHVDMGVPEESMFSYEVEDLDGHIWEPMWMNPNFVPSAE